MVRYLLFTLVQNSSIANIINGISRNTKEGERESGYGVACHFQQHGNYNDSECLGTRQSQEYTVAGE